MLNMLSKPNKFLIKSLLGGVLLLCPMQLFAQITIGGDVYGGGKEGAVGTGNLADGITDATAPEDVTFATGTPATTEATNVTINGGTVRTVFGGGQNGRTYGSTKVEVKNTVSTVATKIGGTVNDVDWTGTIHGGLFGAGDGEHAYVFGNSTVTIEAGTIYQNVYGGGNQAELGGNTLVTLQGGDLQGDVFGGARMADIQGYSEVNVDGANIKNDLVVNYVYGGNDISGMIHGEQTVNSIAASAYVHSSVEKTAATGETQMHIFIGQLYAGGNGDYPYADGSLTMVDVPKKGDTPATTATFTGLSKPELPTAYLNIQGGTFGYAFGGGNSATITGQTNISLNNTSTISTASFRSDPAATTDVLNDDRLEAMGLNPVNFHTDVQFNRVFGGNNKVDMAIRPTWLLTKASIYDLYSGGNEGGMTYPNGIFLPIQSADMTVQNVYGGCRKADVNPGSTAPTEETLNEHDYQAGYAARVLVTAGQITNVYGGNDVSGMVHYGTDLQILSSVIGDVYGGGNGAYVFTDNVNLKDHDIFRDLYYGDGTTMSAANSVAALNAFRPQAEKSYIHVAGTSTTQTVIGRVFGGGNSATVSGLNDGDIHLQLGQYVTIEDVFLGSNGAQMSDAVNTLPKYTSGEVDEKEISQIDLTNSGIMATYMEGAAVACMPTYAFDNDYPTTAGTSLARIGSFYGGGNVGSMTSTKLFNIIFDHPITLTKKLVGGCNAATVAATDDVNAENVGGFTGTSEEKIHIDVNGIVFDVTPTSVPSASAGNQGNVFGGCFESGVVKGNVEIKVLEDIIPSTYFATDEDKYNYLANPGNVLATPLSIFGGGYGAGAIVEGNTTIDIVDNGGALKVFGGGYGGRVGSEDGTVGGNTTVNLLGTSNVGDLYGGGFEGPITHNAVVNLNGGTAYDVIGGACNAEIGGHTEVYVGAEGFPTIINNVYGANDFGGEIKGTRDFTERVTTDAASKVYNASLPTASAYVEYIKGKVKYIFGGAKAAYNYKDQSLYSDYANADGTAKAGFSKPLIGNAFVNFRPSFSDNSSVTRVYGAGPGYYNERDKDMLQSNSYVLIDVPADIENFAGLEVFGAGDYSGVGMNIKAADVRTAEATEGDVTAAAVIDLVRGNINSVYGGSYKQGFTRRTIVNVPEGSTIDMNYLYGGAYGVAAGDGNTLGNLFPCDVYESNVNFKSEDARVKTIYGGNNSYRRTLYTHVNIYTPVQYVHPTFGLTHANVFGAGYGENTWAQYTEVNLFDGAKVYEAYGGGEAGSVYNKVTTTTHAAAAAQVWDIRIPGDYATTDASYDHGGLDNALAHSNQFYADYGPTNDKVNVAEKYNTNVHIHKGATVLNYAYGAGLGSHIYTYQFDGDKAGNTLPLPSDYIAGADAPEDLDAEARAKYESALEAYRNYDSYDSSSTVGAVEYNSFNDTQKSHWSQVAHRTTAVVSGTSYIDLLGGTVVKDLYAAGTTGAVQDTLMIGGFTATSTAYVKGGTARNIYGGGWEGPVGKHDMSKPGTFLDEDKLGVTNVIVGRPEEDIATAYEAALAADASLNKEEYYFYNGVPAITRNAYAGGEGGVVRGTANLNIFNGLVGYRFKEKGAITEAEKNYYKIQTDAEGHITYKALYDDSDLSSESYLYVEEIDQDAPGDNIIYEAGNAFGGGYAANSDVDIANITLWDGIIRNSMYGGGEIATIGRGTQAKNSSTNEFDVTIYKPGETHVTMWGGHVIRDVFGGGRGFNNWKTEDKTEGNTNGYVFGKTDVNIHLGIIGTPDGLEKGYGNVFGGGNVGFVYSQYEKKDDGWYYEDYTSSPKVLSEDTRVEVKVYGKALNNVSIGGTTYKKDAFIPNTALDQLAHNASQWTSVDQSGITIYNAVFAGGNVSAGSDKIMAFSKTVYGNSTASVVDIYGRDLISVGGSGVGGLYGDGNLTFVDGYRELNITNYGTDYYYLSGGVTDEEFNNLTPRQQSFYTNQYKCITAYTDGTYDVGDIIMSDVYNLMSDDDQAHWTRTRSIVNEGRFINTLQRCDFCGIKGSHIVLHGAIDRAQDESEADYTNYTINRVGELSLNQNHQSGQSDHGNYFGIYNVVKFLGGVTSDVQFAGTGGAVRQTESGTGYQPDATGQTYYEWKEAHITENNRNDGSAPNKIALSSGVFLEIVKNLNPDGSKNYGPITGVVELDLLNVTPGEGGGYVYAKNIHGTPSYNPTFADVISDANQNMVTNRAFTYSPASAGDDMQTSGNFIHSQPKIILDDCFPEPKSYAGSDASPAHYWYIRGEFYVYEQLVSAYTGGADAYSTEMSIPLTMAIQGNAKLRLLNVIPGLYADPAKLPNYHYNADEPELSVSDSISIINNSVIKTYGQGDPISYWDWYCASNSDRNMFVVDTCARVCNTEATFGGKTYYPGQAITAAAYSTLSNQLGVNSYGEEVKGDTIFSVINEVSNGEGYLLTVDFSNPSKWDDYYRHLEDESDDPIKKMVWEGLTEAQKEQYIKSATFKCTAEGTYGQYYFQEDEIISHNVHEMQTAVEGHVASETQATFDAAYMAKVDCEVSVGGVLKSFTKGTPISKTDYDQIVNNSTYFEPAYICVSTVLVANGDYRVLNQLVGESEKSHWSSEIQQNFQQAYFCTKAGSWGGKYYEAGKNYNGVDYGQLLPTERQYFTYNYDALDALLYSKYEADVTNRAYNYDEISDYTSYINDNNNSGTARNTAITVFDAPGTSCYAIPARLDYTATFNSDNTGDQFKYVKDGANKEVRIGGTGETLNNDEYESLPNDRKYYASFAVSDSHLKDKDDATWSDGKYHTFIVNTTFDVAGNMYNAGKSISHEEFCSLTSDQKAYVDEVIIPYDDSAGHGAGTYYFCIEKYTVGANDGNVKNADGTDITSPTEIRDYSGTHVYAKGSEVPVGTILNANMMLDIPNYQAHFDIHGEIPVEETTLYVPVSADINALQRDRYVTAIYEYTYTESDAQGLNYETRVEKHILNIRIKFLSGTPIIGSLKVPDLVLPLETVGLDIPAIQEGAFPILGGGWEIYPTEENAKRHRNGREYINGGEPLYFYQNDYYVAYYALTRMGKTFSDPVPLTVANYQRMADVINNPNHMYINHRDNDRDPKIYIDGRAEDTYGDPIRDKDEADVVREYQNELDAMHAMWRIVNTSYGSQYSEAVDEKSRNITGAHGLEFFLQNEVRSELPSWTPIGDDTQCFNGTFHGNGNTVTGLNNSLFGQLCGSVYNLGVMGNFTSGGIANTGDGRIENAWVWTSATPSGNAVYATPGTDARVINTFYPDANHAFVGSTGNVEVTERPVEDFVNGSVAYDLNRFYLEARYRLNGQIEGSIIDSLYYRLPDGSLKKDTSIKIVDANGKRPNEDGYIDTYASQTYPVKYADADYARFTKLLDTDKKLGYVEKYYDDGDFRFSDGLKPKKADLRLSPTYGYMPLYPDDYIFFGQKLTYGILNDAGGNVIAHATHPQAVVKSHTTGSAENVDNSKHGLLINDVNDRSENRVYRAPAYFRNGTYGSSVMFNANAAFADSYDFAISGVDYSTQPHAQMTAVDFTGGNGDTHGYQGVVAGVPSDFKDRSEGYKPLLDFERIDRISTKGITQNLLAYTPSIDIPNTKNAQTRNVLVNYFHDLTYSETNSDYHTVAVQDASGVKGHVVLQAAPPASLASGSDYSYATNVDHFLVDKQDFNAPIAYDFDSAHRMWYQRTPENYVELTWSSTDPSVRTSKGWIDVSLPFSAEIVTTQTKGELTHFYKKNGSDKFERGYDSGHEYWLRGFNDGGTVRGDIYEANFKYPEAGSNEKEYTNTFLWDYYYQYLNANRQDDNTDEYQQQYYAASKTYSDYPYSEAGKPYIVGLPGSTYYEFDLSGSFVPEHSLEDVARLSAQVITFASPTGGSIAKSDTEIEAAKAANTFGGYVFTPNYLNTSIAAGSYLLNADGDSYTKLDAAEDGQPFRPYFTATGGGVKPYKGARAITFNNVISAIGEEQLSDERFNGELIVTAKRGRICVNSGLREEATVRIVNPAGALFRVFTIQPGQTIETPAAPGVYIVNKKKISVR